MVRRLLTDAGRDDLVEPAQLLVSEVVTNALVHSATPIDVSVAATEDGVLVEIGDGSQHVPRPRHYAPTASTGRGLALLDQTADAWGVVPGIRGKTVWFQLSSVDEHAEARAVVAGGGAAGRPDPLERPDAAVIPLRGQNDAAHTATVELLNVPLLLHAAWQQHAEGMLREYLLASMDLASEDDALTVHAAATDALAVLAEHIPAPDVGTRPDEVMSNAVDPRVSRPRIEVVMPRSCVAHFAVLDRTLDRATTLGEQGELLLPAVQPEMRMLRRWLCDQVASQVGGAAAPVAWPPPEVLESPPQRDVPWDPTEVNESRLAKIAADDTGLIVAVSRNALDLLGYDGPEELVGSRLVTIIPDRYRQAHLAGFSLYLLTGRGPLLERPVPVPALRRDHSEIGIELSVEARHLTLGHSLFIATFDERPSAT
jgi:PAS domain S-box-containing protein